MKPLLLVITATTLFCTTGIAQDTASPTLNDRSGTIKVDKTQGQDIPTKGVCRWYLSIAASGLGKEVKEMNLSKIRTLDMVVYNCDIELIVTVLSFELIVDDKRYKSKSNGLTDYMRGEFSILKKGDSILLKNIYYKIKYPGIPAQTKFMDVEKFFVI